MQRQRNVTPYSHTHTDSLLSAHQYTCQKNKKNENRFETKETQNMNKKSNKKTRSKMTNKANRIEAFVFNYTLKEKRQITKKHIAKQP